MYFLRLTIGHTNVIYNPFLNNIQQFESVRDSNTVYIGKNHIMSVLL